MQEASFECGLTDENSAMKHAPFVKSAFSTPDPVVSFGHVALKPSGSGDETAVQWYGKYLAYLRCHIYLL